MELIEKVIDKLPKVSSDINYWLVRTNSGEYYDEFVHEDFIGIGWNKVTLKDLERIQPIEEVVGSYYKDEKRPKYVGNQIKKFVDGIKANDIVLIPSKNSRYINCGIVIDDNTYEVDLPILEEDEILEMEEGICPYRKRKKVRWIKSLKRSDLDPKLYLLLYSHHTISEANPYKDLINRAIYDMYIQDDKCYATFYVNREDNIEARHLVEFISNILSVNNMLVPDEADTMEMKISIQSPGVTEIIDKAQNIVWTCIVIYSIIGGKFKIPFLLDVDTKGVAGVVKDFMELAKKQDKEIDKKIQGKIKENAEKLNLNQPDELRKAIDEIEKEKND